MDKYEKRHSGEFSGLLHIKLDASTTEEFISKFKGYLDRIMNTEEGASSYTDDELKRLVRHYAREHDSVNPEKTFSQGAYMMFFQQIRGKDKEQSSKLKDLCVLLHSFTTLLDKEDLSSEQLTKFITDEWPSLVNLAGAKENDEYVQFLLWKLLLPIVQGVMQINEITIEGEKYHFSSFADPKVFIQRYKDKKRTAVLKKLREAFGRRLDRTPKLVSMLSKTKLIDDEHRAPIIEMLKSKDKESSLGGDQLSTFLTRDVEVLALSENDLIDEYFEVMKQFINHLETEVYKQTQKNIPDHIFEYLKFMKNTFLPILREYCTSMRKFREQNPFIADLITEPYLLRIGLVDGTQEPSALHLFTLWKDAYEKIRQSVVYTGKENFSFVETHKAVKRSEVKKRFDKTEYFIQTPASGPKAGLGTGRAKKTELWIPSVQGIQDTTKKTMLGVANPDGIVPLPIAQTDPALEPKPIEEDSWDDVFHPDKQTEKPVSPFAVTDLKVEVAVDITKSRRIIIKQKLDSIILASTVNTIGRLENLQFFLDELDDEDQRTAESLLAEEIHRSLKQITDQIVNGQFKLETEGETELFNIINAFILNRYACTKKLKKIFALEICEFYCNCKRRGSLDQSAINDIYVTITALLGVIKSKWSLPKAFIQQLKDKEILNDEDNETGNLPSFYGANSLESLNQIPALKDYPFVEKLLSEEENELISQFVNFLGKELNKLENFGHYYELEADSNLYEDTGQLFILHVLNIKKKLGDFRKNLKELHIQKKGGYGVRLKRWISGRKSITQEIDKYYTALDAHLENSWEKAIKPSLLLYGNLILGE